MRNNQKDQAEQKPSFIKTPLPPERPPASIMESGCLDKERLSFPEGTSENWFSSNSIPSYSAHHPFCV